MPMAFIFPSFDILIPIGLSCFRFVHVLSKIIIIQLCSHFVVLGQLVYEKAVVSAHFCIEEKAEGCMSDEWPLVIR